MLVEHNKTSNKHNPVLKGGDHCDHPFNFLFSTFIATNQSTFYPSFTVKKKFYPSSLPIAQKRPLRNYSMFNVNKVSGQNKNSKNMKFKDLTCKYYNRTY